MFPKTCGGHGDLGPIRKRHSGGTEKRNEGLRRDTLSGEFQWLGSLHNLFLLLPHRDNVGSLQGIKGYGRDDYATVGYCHGEGD